MKSSDIEKEIMFFVFQCKKYNPFAAVYFNKYDIILKIDLLYKEFIEDRKKAIYEYIINLYYYIN